jgi:ABC-type oligopeptide transport system substrate-binding subunit
MVPGSGLYTIDEKNIIKGRSIGIDRREDYWDKDNPSAVD